MLQGFNLDDFSSSQDIDKEIRPKVKPKDKVHPHVLEPKLKQAKEKRFKSLKHENLKKKFRKVDTMPIYLQE